MNSHFLNPNLLDGAVLPIDLDGIHLSQHGQAITPNNMAKHGIHAVQMGRLIEQDEELTPIGARPFVCHADDPASVMPQRRPNLVLERLFPDGDAALGLGGRRASLDHEVGNEPVEQGAIVVARGAESEEVLDWGLVVAIVSIL
jgi:hypothetical protein